jgi:hypothetical protein
MNRIFSKITITNSRMNPTSAIIPVEFITSRSSSLSFLHSILKSLSDEIVPEPSLSALEQAAENLLESKDKPITLGNGRVFKAQELPRHLRRRTTSHLSASSRHKHPERGQGGQNSNKQSATRSLTESERDDQVSSSISTKRRRLNTTSEEQRDMVDNDDDQKDEGGDKQAMPSRQRRSRRRSPAILKEFWKMESIAALQALSNQHISRVVSPSSKMESIQTSTSNLSFRSVTHLWQAKRMKMQKFILSPDVIIDPSTDGKQNIAKIECVLPQSRLDTSTSSAIEWARSTEPATCVAFDSSHLIAVIMTGRQTHLLDLLQSVLDPSTIECNDSYEDEDDNKDETVNDDTNIVINKEDNDKNNGGEVVMSDNVSVSDQTMTSAAATSTTNIADNTTTTSLVSRAKKAKIRRASAKLRWKSKQKVFAEKESSGDGQCGGILQKEFVSGACAAVDVMLFSPKQFPKGAIAPVTIAWLPSDGGTKGKVSRQVLVLVHISALHDLMNALRDAANATCPVGGVNISLAGNGTNTSPPCIVSLRGAGTREAISSLNCSFFKNAGVATSSAKVGSLAKGIVYGVTAFSSSSTDSISSGALKIATSLSKAAKSMLNDEFVPLMEDSARTESKTKLKQNDDGFMPLVSNQPLQSDENEQDLHSVQSSSSLLMGAPIMFIKRACSGPKHKEVDDASIADTVDSCVLVIPPSAAQDVWLQLVTRGKARAVGDLEWGRITCERGHSYFPRDFPETKAGKTWWEQKLLCESFAESKKPILKRRHTSLPFSFSPKWNLLWPSSTSTSGTSIPPGDDNFHNVDKDIDHNLPLVVRQQEFKSSFLSPTGAVAAHPTLIPFRLLFPGRAPRITDVAGIYLPTVTDLSLWKESIISSELSLPKTSTTKDGDPLRLLIPRTKIWLGVEEEEEEKVMVVNDESNKKDIMMSEIVEENEEEIRAKSVRSLKIRAKSVRSLIGFVTSLCLSPSISRVIGTAFVEAEACRIAASLIEAEEDEKEEQNGHSAHIANNAKEPPASLTKDEKLKTIKVLVRSPFSKYYHPAILLLD